MFKVKAIDGKNNLCGENIKEIRLSLNKPLSQRSLAKELQKAGCDLDHYAIRRIENGERFVTDIELVYFAEVLGVSLNTLVKK